MAINFGALTMQPQGQPFQPLGVKPQALGAKGGQLDEASRSKLDGIVQRMTTDKQTPETIQLVVNDFKGKYGGGASAPMAEEKAPTGGIAGFGVGALKGVGSTITGMSKLGSQFANQTAGRVVNAIGGKGFTPLSNEQLGEDIANPESQFAQGIDAKLTPQGTAQNVGFGAERIAEFLVPATKITQGAKAAQMVVRGTEAAPSVLRRLGGLGARAGIEGTGAGAIQTAQQGEVNGNTGLAFGLSAGAPLLARSIPAITKGAASLFTGVPKEVLSRAASPEYAPRIDSALKEIADNPKQPFLSLAKRLQSSIGTNVQKAKDAFVLAKDKFKAQNPGATFDMRNRTSQFLSPLKQFNLEVKMEPKLPSKKVQIVPPKTSEGLPVIDFNAPPKAPSAKPPKLNKSNGVFATPKIVKRAQSPFSSSDVSHLQTLVNKIQLTENASLDDLLDLEKSFGAAYQAKPLGPNQSPTQYHAAVMALKENAENMIEEALPAGMRAAYKQYRRVMNLKDTFGSRIVDASGKLKDGAEQYLANLANMNKGNLRSEISEYADDIGFDLADEVQVIKDAQKLNELFPATGSRTQDIVRSLGVGALGFGAGGPLMGGVGLAASSPKVIGRGALEIGKLRGKLPSIPEFLK